MLNEIATQLNTIATDLRSGRGTAGKLFANEAIYNDARAASCYRGLR